jgi:hypothetical protein
LDPRFLDKDSKSIQANLRWHLYDIIKKGQSIGLDQKMKPKTADGLKNQDVS